ncbi:15200_t:CDS:2, partial [Entrophospora sp. SA101]
CAKTTNKGDDDGDEEKDVIRTWKQFLVQKFQISIIIEPCTLGPSRLSGGVKDVLYEIT